jgi:hypothetical protein
MLLCESEMYLRRYNLENVSGILSTKLLDNLRVRRLVSLPMSPFNSDILLKEMFKSMREVSCWISDGTDDKKLYDKSRDVRVLRTHISMGTLWKSLEDKLRVVSVNDEILWEIEVRKLLERFQERVVVRL